jgi:tetratricopeptide (TPR) repeat protein
MLILCVNEGGYMVKTCMVFAMLMVLVLTGGYAAAGPMEDIKAGNLAAQSGDLKRAIKLYTKAIDSKKLSRANLAVAYTNRGVAQDDLGQSDLAVLDYIKAVKADPRYAIAYYNRSFVYEKKDLMGMALKDAEKALALSPDDKDYKERIEYLKYKMGM